MIVKCADGRIYIERDGSEIIIHQNSYGGVLRHFYTFCRLRTSDVHGATEHYKNISSWQKGPLCLQFIDFLVAYCLALPTINIWDLLIILSPRVTLWRWNFAKIPRQRIFGIMVDFANGNFITSDANLG